MTYSLILFLKKGRFYIRADNETNVSLPTTTNTINNTTNDNNEIFLFGRRTIYSSLKEKELTTDKIIEILPSVLRIHDLNAVEIDYLWRYYKGEQPIINKTKIVREDINNKVVENHAYEIVEFKKSNDFGEPVQYVQKGEKNNNVINPEISLLNRHMESENKASLDLELSEWQQICGTSYRWVDTDTENTDDDEAPFEIAIPDPRTTFVVYSSDIKHKPLFSGHFSWFSQEAYTPDNGQIPVISRYRIITIYTEDRVIKFKEEPVNQNGKIINSYTIIPNLMTFGDNQTSIDEYPLSPKGNRIIEYPLNKARIGSIELVMSQLNALNKIKSDDIDAIDQFVQSLLVFINQDVSVEDVKELEEAGAIKVFTADPRKTCRCKTINTTIVA